MEKEYQKIKSIINQQLQPLIEKQILDKSVWFEIDSVDFQKQTAPYSQNPHTQILIKIKTNNRPVIAGQFASLEENGLYGFNIEYVTGFLSAALQAKKIRNFNILLDIHQVGKLPKQSKIRFVPLAKALRQKTVLPASEISKTMKRYGLKYLETRGSDVIGPYPSTIDVFFNVFDKIKPKKVLDLFAGTGAVASVALSHSDCTVTCVDYLTADLMRKSLAKFGKRVSVVKADIYDYKIDGSYDLVFADPHEYMALDVARRLSSKISRKSLFLLTHGLVTEQYWSKLVRKELRKHFKIVKKADRGDIAASLCSN